jgi:3-dehydroquinate synthase
MSLPRLGDYEYFSRMLIRSRSYTISVENKDLKSLNDWLKKHRASSTVILCDNNTKRNCLPMLTALSPGLSDAPVIEIPAGEAGKNPDTATAIWEQLLSHRCDRDSLLINLGGGMVSDIGGFCASVFKRGIGFIHLPTSLLAMADASVGGKTGIDLGSTRNVIGTFAEPRAVFVFTPFLKTLPEEHYRSGLAEIYKIGLVAGKSLWSELKKMKNRQDDASLIAKSIALKVKVVEKDPLDKGYRKILNFGHSAGHALESIYLEEGKELLHGMAVAAGMIMETNVAWQLKLIDRATMAEISGTLHSRLSPPVLRHIPASLLARYLLHDKKNSGGKLMFALIDGIGSCRHEVEVDESNMSRAMDYYNSLFK